MKISQELRMELIQYLHDDLAYNQENGIQDDRSILTEELLKSLTYKKRGRKVGWRKRPESFTAENTIDVRYEGVVSGK